MPIRKQWKEGVFPLLTLKHLRAKRFTQREIGQALGIAQENVSSLEGSRDKRISTLRKYVEALGAKLRILAVFPEETVEILLGEEDRHE